MRTVSQCELATCQMLICHMWPVAMILDTKMSTWDDRHQGHNPRIQHGWPPPEWSLEFSHRNNCSSAAITLQSFLLISESCHEWWDRQTFPNWAPPLSTVGVAESFQRGTGSHRAHTVQICTGEDGSRPGSCCQRRFFFSAKAVKLERFWLCCRGFSVFIWRWENFWVVIRSS